MGVSVGVFVPIVGGPALFFRASGGTSGVCFGSGVAVESMVLVVLMVVVVVVVSVVVRVWV